jgi:hypothetical protein
MTIIFKPSSCLFPDTAVGSVSYRKIACYQDKLMVSEHDISVNASKPFTSKPYNESAYGKSVLDNERMLRNYVSKQYEDSVGYRIVDVLDSVNNIFNTVNRAGTHLKLYKTSKSSFVETEVTLCAKTVGTFISRDAGKHMVYDSSNNYILCAYMYENGAGHNFEVKKINPDDLSVVDTYTDTHANYNFDIKDIILGEGDILYIVGSDGTDGKLIAFDVLSSFALLHLETIAGYPAHSVSAKYANNSQYVFAGCEGLLHTYSWTLAGGFVLQSQSIPDPGEGIPVSMPRDFGLIKNSQYAVVADEINKFTPSHCLKSEAATPLYVLFGSKNYSISDFIFTARFIPTTDDQDKIIYTDGRETFRIHISSANVLTVDIDPAGTGWLNMVTSVAIPVVANDTIDMYLARQNNVWLLLINGTVYALTDGAEFDTDIDFATGNEIANVFSDATGDFFLRSMKLELATEVLFDFVFNYSSSGSHTSNGFVMSVSDVAYSQPTASYALFREYPDRIQIAEANIIGAVIHKSNTMYVIRDNATRDNSISRIDINAKSVTKNSGNLISDSNVWTSVAVFTRNMVASVLDDTLYFCTSIPYGTYDTLVYTGKTNLDLSYESNAKYCELAFAPAAASVFSDNLVINTVDSLPILGIGYVQEARVVPYSTIMIENCGDDYMRYNYANPDFYTVFKYRRFPEWDLPEASSRYVYNSKLGTFTQNAAGTFERVEEILSAQGIQSLGSQFDAYFDTVNFYYDISQAHLIKNNPVGFFLVSAVSMMANEITYTLDSNYRFNTDREIKLNGRKEETSLFSDSQLCYALGSKQIEVNEITAINSRDHRCIKFRIKMRRSNPDITDFKNAYDDWRIFEIKYTPSDLFYVEGE